ncbi:hypothetical protein E308F_16180 [Moorella sp. E308F]|uniref:zinc chelation protein SecC n=1 Tax=unclassified Neomoorella TaxID=2676739 RepID=UPI0010FFAA2D|nr:MULTISPECIES: zinc chelation protein SecC [unclassified Moorella (in: firmicutes)]GEA15374.1 hypothetical protein E308F_16180 [Moorella sp. E308F]GEA19765.1 hypothetical protein E306M_29040 [Moorella sp. E306M]
MVGDVMSGKKIKDNYSFKEMEFNLQGFKSLKAIYKLAYFFGFKNESIKKSFEELQEIDKKFKQLQEIPDKFNQYFAQRGWIAYESMNFDIMAEAVKFAEEGKMDKAEEVLINYYDNKENLLFMISRLKGIEEFQPRIRLIHKALDDYIAGRYHACIPVVLMMIDGFVNDIEQKGFFATGIDLNVWDSIAAHDSGLNTLTKILGESRKKTSTDEIYLPYRHGILHGRDLGYDNKIIALKTWATLFALGDWARAVKSGKKGINKEFKAPTIKESIQSIKDSLEQYNQIQNEKKLIEQWEPRTLNVNADFPEKGQVSDYQEGSPEKTLVEYFEYLFKGNYGKMALLTTKLFPSDDSIKKLAGEIRKIFQGKRLIDFKFISVEDRAPAITEIKVKLTFEKKNTDKVTIEHSFRLIYVDNNCKPLTRNSNRGAWRIMLNFNDIEFI